MPISWIHRPKNGHPRNGWLDRLRWTHLTAGIIIALLAISLIFIAANIADLQANLDKFRQLHQLRSTLEVSLQIRELQKSVTHIQQWFTDLAATNGLDGLDEGRAKAQEGHDTFRRRLASLPRLLAKLPGGGETGVGKQLEELAPRIDHFHALGARMARAYRESGTLQGNLIMKEFDAEAEAIDATLATMATTFEKAFNKATQPHPPAESFPTASRPDPAKAPGPASPPSLARAWSLLLGRDAYYSYLDALAQALRTGGESGLESALALEAQEMQEAVLGIWQWLTDISVTRGRDGLDAGFTRAAYHRDQFLRILPGFREKVHQVGRQDWIDTAEGLETSLIDLHRLGEEMARAYITGGTARGNPIMKRFDDACEHLIGLLGPFTVRLLEQSDREDFQMELARENLTEVLIMLRTAFLAGALLALILGAMSLRSLAVSAPGPARPAARSRK
ncbi:MAG: hypothetical protein HQL57_09470 [Magnetococcales bacterium]|nr:hypothetical protein [Magnetococcales bacterium]MBF0157398.1 hypothetical protein [Magnetococcales bacterium]